MTTKPFDYAGAKKAGYSDEEINDYLGEAHSFDVKSAKKSGYSSKEINDYLSAQPQKPSGPVTLQGSAAQYGVGAAAGAKGLVGDVANLVKGTGIAGAAGQLIPDIKGTHESAADIQKEFNVDDPVNSLERILRQSGEWGGQEALIGTAVGGPAGAGAGLAHGSASGALYGSLKEAGMDDTWALGLTALTTLSPIAARRLLPKVSEYFSKVKSGKTPPPPPAEILEAVKKSAPQAAPEALGGLPGIGEELPTGRKGADLSEAALEHLQGPSKGDLKGGEGALSHEVGSEISPQSFYNEKHGGLNLSGNVKKKYEEVHRDVTKKYKVAEKSYQGQKDIFPGLVNKTEESLAKLAESAEPSTAERAVIKQLEAVQKMIGTKEGLIEAPLSRLVKTADSMSQLVKYEIPGGGVKNVLKGFVKDLNASVVASLESRGLSSAAIKSADKAYGKMADTFFSDELAPFMARKIRNPESVYRSVLTDEGVHRAVKEAIGKEYPKSLSRLERDIAEKISRPYINDLRKVGSRDFEKDMAALEGRIGKEGSKKIKNKLIKESHNPSHKYQGKKLEHVDKMMDSVSGIREMRKDFAATGKPEIFEELAREKAIDILRGGKVRGGKLTGRDVLDHATSIHNYEILSELYGKEVVEAMIADAEVIGKRVLTKENLVQLGKMAIKVAGAAKLLKAVSIFFPGV